MAFFGCTHSDKNEDIKIDKTQYPNIFDVSNMEDSLCQIGIELAHEENENGKLGYYTYGLQVPNFNSYLLHKHYNIEDKGGSCFIERYGVCYNEIMKEEILKTFGKTIAELSTELQHEADSFMFAGGPNGVKYKRGFRAKPRDVYCNLIFPEEVDTNKMYPRVIVELTIDTFGKAVNPKIGIGYSKSFDEEALRVVKHLGDWEPATHEGKKIVQKVLIAIPFDPKHKQDCD